MQKEWKNALGKIGYSEYVIDEKNAVLLGKYEDGSVKLLLLLDNEKETEFNTASIKELHNGLAVKYGMEFEGKPVYQVSIVTMISGITESSYRVLCANVEHVWALDIYQSDVIMPNADLERMEYQQICQCIKPVLAGEAKARMRKERLEEARDQNPYHVSKDSFLNYFKNYYVTVSLIVINVLCYMILELLGDTMDVNFAIRFGAHCTEQVFDKGEYWRLFTSMFYHFGFLHLANNMIFLAAAGVVVEGAMGHLSYLITYLLAGLGGNIISECVLLAGKDNAVAAGASGAIYGLIGALLFVLILNKGRYKNFKLPQIIFMVILIIYYGTTSVEVDHWAHGGGFVCGIILTLLLYHPYLKKKKDTNI